VVGLDLTGNGLTGEVPSFPVDENLTFSSVLGILAYFYPLARPSTIAQSHRMATYLDTPTSSSAAEMERLSS
jgi:hypothetical protein